MGHRARILRAGILGSLTATTVGLLAGLVLALPAGARTCTKNIAPPGHAGSAQYYETVPTSCGNASPPTPGGSGSSSGGGVTRLGHGRAGLHALSHLGTNGRAAAALAAATAPPVSSASSGGGGVSSGGNGSGSGHAGSGTAGGSGSVGVGKSTGSGLPWTGSASGALGSALTGSGGGLGVLLPILMGLGLIAAIGAGVVRARRSGRPSV